MERTIHSIGRKIGDSTLFFHKDISIRLAVWLRAVIKIYIYEILGDIDTYIHRFLRGGLFI